MVDRFTKSLLQPEFSDDEWEIIKPLLQKVILKEREILFEDESKAEDLYFIEQGSLEVSKKGHCLAILQKGRWVGEIAVLDNTLRTASVRAHKKSILTKISLNTLQKATKDHPNIYTKIISLLSKNMADHLRKSNKMTIASIEKKLELEKTRNAMGQFICYFLMGLGGFFFIVKGITLPNLNSYIFTVTSAFLLLFLSYFIFMIIKKSRYPLSFYGITLKHWKASVGQALFYTVILAIILIPIKWFLITFIPAYHDTPLFIIHQLLKQPWGVFTWIFTNLIYTLFVPVQELIARGCLQGLLEKFLVGRRKIFFSIILSNLMFSTLHLQISLTLAITVFFLGCFWGWLYSKNKTLVGVSLSHAILGNWGFSILGAL